MEFWLSDSAVVILNPDLLFCMQGVEDLIKLVMSKSFGNFDSTVTLSIP